MPLASAGDVPLGWTYSPSSYVQRIPIVALAFVGLFISRYLAAFQLGHIPTVWDGFFAGFPGTGNGTEAVITSAVSKAFPSPMQASAPLPMPWISSRARSVTGLVAEVSGALNLRPRAAPAMILIT